jgi:hypothetical protein
METFSSRDVLLPATFCYGDVLYVDVLSRRRFVWRLFVFRRNFVGKYNYELRVRCFHEKKRLSCYHDTIT